MGKIIYDKNFYDGQSRGSLRSAQTIVPLILDFFEVTSVVDIGCGVGTWLNVFSTCGISDVLGVDGDYVDRSALMIPSERFRPADLSRPLHLDRRFDLAISLEVAEHIVPEAAETFVDNLVRCAPIVVFSAAIPDQGGMDHINERWLSYWTRLFSKHGFEPYDLIRPLVYNRTEVEWWYQQNIIVFSARGSIDAQYEPAKSNYDIDRIHPQMLKGALSGPHTGQQALTAVTRGVRLITHKVLQKAKVVG